MNYDFDFNIYNYSIGELLKFLTLDENYTLNDINEKSSKMNTIITESKDYDKEYKSRLSKFLEEAKLKLVKHVKEISQGDDGFIEDYDKPIIDNKITSSNFKEKIEKHDNVGKIIYPMSTSHQPLQKIQIPNDSNNPYSGNINIQNYIFNTQFRDNFFFTTPEDCTFTLPIKIKNIISISLSAVEIPNVFLTFSEYRGTNQIYIYENVTGLEAIVNIPQGNYNITTFPSILEQAINIQVIGSHPNRFQVSINQFTHFLTISNTTYTFNMNLVKKDFDFIKNCDYSKYAISNVDNIVEKNSINVEPSQFCNTMGYLMGYRKIEYFGQQSYTTESMFNEAGNNDYIYFSLNEYTTSSQYIVNCGVLPFSLIDDNILAMVPITSAKFSTTFANSSNYIFKTRNYNGPIDIQKISIKLLTSNGSLANIFDNDFSFVIQVKTIYDITKPYKPKYNLTS